jgi:hypothetical protein
MIPFKTPISKGIAGGLFVLLALFGVAKFADNPTKGNGVGCLLSAFSAFVCIHSAYKQYNSETKRQA